MIKILPETEFLLTGVEKRVGVVLFIKIGEMSL